MTYLGRRHSPNLEIVRPHKDLRQTLPDISNVPLVKVLGLVQRRPRPGVQGGVDQALEAPGLLLLGQDCNVILEGIGHPLGLVPHVRDALVRVPVV